MRKYLQKYKPIVQLEIDDEILLNAQFGRLDIENFMRDIQYEIIALLSVMK